MTWKEFKEQVEAQGVKDSDEIFWIDTENYPDKIHADFETRQDGRREVEISRDGF